MVGILKKKMNDSTLKLRKWKWQEKKMLAYLVLLSLWKWH